MNVAIKNIKHVRLNSSVFLYEASQSGYGSGRGTCTCASSLEQDSGISLYDDESTSDDSRSRSGMTLAIEIPESSWGESWADIWVPKNI